MIRKATAGDLPAILPIFDRARERMRQTGNPDQWKIGYPSVETISADIRDGNFYVEETDGKIEGCFAFIIGKEPTYETIDGEWIDDLPYGTIHRLASAGETRGLAARCIAFCRQMSPNLRADTHRLNLPMQHILKNHGFRYCGIIHVADGSPRLAYQLPARNLFIRQD